MTTPTTPPPLPTPRCDAAIIKAPHWNPLASKDAGQPVAVAVCGITHGQVVPADFARGLERELDSRNVENTQQAGTIHRLERGCETLTNAMNLAIEQRDKAQNDYAELCRTNSELADKAIEHISEKRELVEALQFVMAQSRLWSRLHGVEIDEEISATLDITLDEARKLSSLLTRLSTKGGTV